MTASQYRKTAWSKLSGNWTNAVVVMLIYTAIMGVLGGLSAIGVGAIAILLVTGPLALGLAALFLKISNGEKYEIVEMFDGFKTNFVNSFVLALLMEIFIFLWTLLFVIPGIVATYSYSMSFYILNDNPEMSANEARKASIELMRGHKWQLFCLDLSFIGWIILSILTFGILFLWVEPYMQVAHAEFYKEITGKNNAKAETLEEDPFAEVNAENA